MSHPAPGWRQVVRRPSYKPFGYAAWFDLLEDPDAPLQPGRVLRSGRHALPRLWKADEAAGVSHVVLNLKPTRRPASEILAELAEFVLPAFPAHVI